MRTGIWLSYNNQEEGFKLPVNPENIEISGGNNGKTYSAVGLGEINVIKDLRLRDIKFESIFPAMNYPFVEKDAVLLEPSHYVGYLEKWLTKIHPIRFIYVGETFDINLPTSIEEFTYKEVAGSPGDIEFSLSLKEYLFYEANRAIITSNGVQVDTGRPDERESKTTHKVVPGETLFRIAQKHGTTLKNLQQLNNLTDEQVKKLKVGSVIRLR
ncbi:LysM peptidoglycan-binding domain-containing protein [Paenibacillus larvae]|uniref:LysM peptidoglycan-binding domain-containing protein n=1 Tax=Paenibacillus larvae TaxID=1464 RepID=UPI0022801945|nr:LysM domain-containing protein [Paenibacillus larvae]MCY9511793.1 LysM peptidoglycan-binding domain-containing protein [Paenibacillus larvae]MCY9527397.1 LysM peptidoglycan-binding domain-containing protein [Paenibacillus larvae]